MNHLIHTIKEALSGHGHSCVCDDCMEEHSHHHHHGFDKVMIWRLAAAAVLFIAGMILGEGTPALIVYVLSILLAGYDVFISAVANIYNKKIFGEALLMSIVAVAAVVIGEAKEGASVMFLYQLGELFQGYAVAKVRHNIEELMENRSPEATDVLSDVRANRSAKGRTEEFISKFCRVYTPVVLGIALLVFLLSLFTAPVIGMAAVTASVYKALVIMVIACPCAIVISVPLSYFAGIGGATRLGILFKNTGAMDAVSRTLSVVFDKAGSLESDVLRVSSVKSERMDADVFLRIAAHACAYSGGIHAESIKAAYEGVIYIELVESFQEDPGRGLNVSIDGVKIVLGTADYVSEQGIDPGEDLCGEDAAYLGIDGQYTGRILFAKAMKPDATETVTVLSWDSNKEIALLTSDSEAATEKFARQVGIGQYYSECKPSDKIAVVRDIQSRCSKGTLIFVGDPVQDRDCLEQADIGIALRGADSDEALQAADVVIMDNSPFKVVTAIEAARHTRSIVWQNILFALGFKGLILILDLFAMCPLWLAVFADVGVTFLAVLNSLRAFRIKAPLAQK